jgi:hypothetical protein
MIAPDPGLGAIIFLGRSIFRNRQDLEADLRQIGEAEFVCGYLRYVALAGGLLTSVIAAAAGAAVVLFVWRMAK